MSVINAAALLAAAGGDYQISRSVRLRSSASAYFSRTPGSAGNQQKHTASIWIKYSTGSSDRQIISFGNSLTYQIAFGNSGTTLSVGSQQLGVSNPWFLGTTQVFRDPSSWYHIVVAVDTTQATASDRVKVYVNGAQITSFSTANYPSLNYNTGANTTTSHSIGRREDAVQYLDGYLTEFNWIDGQQLTPSSFGETDAVTGVWKPKKYTGTYGTNGFYLNFSDPSAATAAAIGKDYSGNGNNWTPNNISVTAGTTYDSMVDTPTPYADGSTGRGNYATLNPLSKGTSQTNVIDGNLYAVPTSGGSNWGTVFSSIAIPTSGKWYAEATAVVYTGSGNNSSLGVVDGSTFIPTNTAILYQYTTGEGFDGILCHLFSDYVSPISDGVQGTNVTGQTASSINLMLALDVDNGKVFAGYNGTWLNSGNPAGGTGEVATRTFSANDVVAGHTSWNGTNDQAQYFNFGQRPFAYTPPTGFKALNTQNLPEPTIKKGNAWFDATTYTGNGGTLAVVNSGSMQPDMLWIKSRSAATDHALQDSVRGMNLALYPNLTIAEISAGYASTNSNGFNVAGAVVNTNGSTYVGWQWKKGATPGFNVVTFTGNGAASRSDLTHNLGATPKMYIIKNRSTTTNWFVFHNSLGNNGIWLNTTDASFANSAYFSSYPNSTNFYVSTDSSVNGSGNSMVAYLFAEVAGFSKFGSYTGNGSSDGPFVFCGFRPRWILVKATGEAGGWTIIDTARIGYNAYNYTLYAEATTLEQGYQPADILSNGFKIRITSTGTSFNTNGIGYIFAAFAETAQKFSLAR